jgi:hypothetical protein
VAQSVNPTVAPGDVTVTGGRKYVRPAWIDQRIVSAVPGAARLMARLTGDAILQVRGRRSGRMRTTLARPISVGGATYVVAIRGDTAWARNLRASGEARMWRPGGWRRVLAIEVADDERRTVVERFVNSSPLASTRRIMTELLPSADDHPTFRIEPI